MRLKNECKVCKKRAKKRFSQVESRCGKHAIYKEPAQKESNAKKN